MILVPRYPRLILGETVEQALHAWETRPWAQERVDDKVMRAAFFERILAGLHPLADHFPWKRRTRRDRIGHPLMMSGPQQALLGLGGASSDPNFANVKLLMHMEDTGLTDVKGHTVTLNGAVARSSTQAKFGTYSASMGAQVSGNYIGVAGTTDFDWGTGVATTEAWIYCSSTNGSLQVVFHFGNNGGSANTDIGHYIQFDNGDTNFYAGFYTSSTQNAINGASNVTTGAWRHLYLERATSTVLAFGHNGLVSTRTVSSGDGPNAPSGRQVNIGRFSNSSTRPFNGYIDEIRMTVGVARYGQTTNGGSYTIPTAAFPDS